MKRYATATLPYGKLGQATTALRAEPRRRSPAAETHETVDWDTLVATGPDQFTDLLRGVWSEYRAPVA